MNYSLRKETILLVILLVINPYCAEAASDHRGQNLNKQNFEPKSLFKQLRDVKRGHLSDAAGNRSKRKGIAPDNQCGHYTSNSRIFHSTIIGGTEVNRHSYPFVAGLLKHNKTTGRYIIFCGGSIIGDQFILTAAHCLKKGIDTTNLYVNVGDHDRLEDEPMEKMYSIDRIMKHPNHDMSRPLLYDIALLHTSHKISFNDDVSPICLERNSISSYLGKSSRAAIVGWGRMQEEIPVKSRVLREARIMLLKWSECKSYTEMTERICAGEIDGGKDTCIGDSGGPLFIMVDETYIQVGVTSGGKGCGHPNYPGLYTNVSHYINWIEDETNRY